MTDFTKEALPPVYRRNNRDCYLDPVRQKLIYITPEETVRQQVIISRLPGFRHTKRSCREHIHI